ncbi:9778_t:CDS:1 [Paraglomus occultum]|uniref:9778_t:CDS:1 n=1 Tax=Paraglomus occultum TaxID=144539 RepID=A0A9N9BYE4_9GLOM|nr:9778_t:CDS:1 [Paraglomus occultum]
MSIPHESTRLLRKQNDHQRHRVRLPTELLYLIITHLSTLPYPEKTLYACALSTRELCLYTIPFLWSQPFNYASRENNYKIIDAYLSFFTDEEDYNLDPEVPIVKRHTPLFPYASFLKSLEFSNMIASVMSWCQKEGVRARLDSLSVTELAEGNSDTDRTDNADEDSLFDARTFLREYYRVRRIEEQVTHGLLLHFIKNNAKIHTLQIIGPEMSYGYHVMLMEPEIMNLFESLKTIEVASDGDDSDDNERSELIDELILTCKTR